MAELGEAMAEPAVSGAKVKNMERPSCSERVDDLGDKRLEAPRPHRPLPRQRALAQVWKRAQLLSAQCPALASAMAGVFAEELASRDVHEKGASVRWKQ
jgi:hypothetical protein